MMTDPRKPKEHPPTGTCYRFDVRGLTLGETWRISDGPISFLVVLVVKLLGIRTKPADGTLYPREPIRLAPQQLPARSRQALEPAVAEWEQYGLRLVFYYTIRWLGELESAAAVLLSQDGKLSATTSYLHATYRQFTVERMDHSAVSKMPDGVVLVTTGRKRELEEPPHRRVHHLTGRTLAELAAHHRHRLSNIPVEPVQLTEASVADFVAEEEGRYAEFHIGRRVWIAMTPKEVERLRRLGPADDALVIPQIVPEDGQSNRYRSPAAPVTSPQPPREDPRPLAWPWALLWMSWPPILASVSEFSTGKIPSPALLLLIAAASNVGLIDSLYRRKQIRRRWLLPVIWLLLLIGQVVVTAAAVVAGEVLLP